MPESLRASQRLLAVFCGGFLGTLARYGLSLAIQGVLGKSWPYDILIINLTGALMLSLINVLADAGLWIDPIRRLFLNVGLMGAYTTFSSLALGDVLLMQSDQWGPALLYLGLSLIGGFLMVLSGQGIGGALVTARSAHSLPHLVPSQHLDIDDDLLILESDSKDTRSTP